MAKLSIDIGVNLGEATRQLGKLNSALISLNQNADKLVSTLKQIGKINIKPTVGMSTGSVATPQATPKQVPNVFEQYTQGASSASNITDLLEAKLEQLVARSNELKQTLAGGIGFMTPSSSLEELKQVENQIKNVQGLLKSQSFNIVAPKNVPDIFKDFRSGASGAATAIDFLRQREQELINQSNTLKASLSTSVSAGGFQQTVRDIKQVEDELKKVQSLLAVQPPDIFKDFSSGAIQASTALEFLEIKEQELIQESLRLKNALAQASTGEEFKRLQDELNRTEKELNDVTKALNSQRGPISGASSGYGNLTKSTNLANLSLVNVGRVFQDLPFGILGIANNLNPLVEGLRDLSVTAKASGSSLGKELLNSLKGFGGVTLAISAVSAVLSFASVGLSYWTRESKKAKEENDKFTDSLTKAKGNINARNIELDRYIEIARDATKSQTEQNLAIVNANKLIGENGIQITQANKNTKEFTNSVNALKDAWIQEALAAEYSKEIGKLIAERSNKLQERKEIIDAPAVKEAIGLIKTYGETLASADTETAGARTSIKDRIDKLVKPYNLSYTALKTLLDGQADFDKEISKTDSRIQRLKNSFQSASSEASKLFTAAAPPQQDGRQKQLETEIALKEKERAAIKGTYGEQSKQYIEINRQIKIRQDELDKILGKEKSTGNAGRDNKSIAEQLSDAYKEINSDLEKIKARKDLDPLQKATKSVERLKQGIDQVLDIDIKQFDDSRLKELYERLKGFESIKVGLEVEKVKTDLDNAFKFLDEKAKILNIDVSKDKIKEAEKALQLLFDKYTDKNISLLDKQKVLGEIGVLQNTLKELNLNSLVISGEDAFKELTIDVERLNQKKILLGVSIGKEGLQLTKKAVDQILEKKIELLSEKDPVRAAQLNDELQKAQGFLSVFRSEVISERFKEYQKSASGIKEEFQRASKFLPKEKRLELKIEADKDNLQEVSKAIDDLIKSGISPIDPRLIFLKILETKLKVNIEIDEKKRKQLEEETQMLKDNLTSTFTDMGEALGTALAEGGNVGFAIGKSVLESMGNFLSQLGKYYITASELVSKAGPLIGTPMGLAAGIAMVALGAFVRSLAAQGFAEGGFVSGPGSDRSDSIPARLSNGEFVVKAKSVRKYGRGFMEMLNSGNLPITNYKNNFSDLRFADGGLVARQMPNALINRSDFGGDMGGFVAETKISGQDLRLVLKRADRKYSNIT